MIDAPTFPTCLGTLMVSFSVILLKRNAGKITLSGFLSARPELDDVAVTSSDRPAEHFLTLPNNI